MSIVWRILGYLLCVVPATCAVLEYVPVWTATTEGTVSMLGVFLLAIAVLPLWRALRDRLRSPSAWMIWLALFVSLSMLRGIIDGLIAISLVAFPTGMLGALCFRLARRAKGGGRDEK